MLVLVLSNAKYHTFFGCLVVRFGLDVGITGWFEGSSLIYSRTKKWILWMCGAVQCSAVQYARLVQNVDYDDVNDDDEDDDDDDNDKMDEKAEEECTEEEEEESMLDKS
ncbi:hypothetical protein HZH66_012228 [Vespula vulgaris]|uniref:Uncharacterized protein n=1 Tax=Vespula vulgaris TaxID=7454 RepID=A0A834MTV0_VESVU|nr:hypothetical protein HZH66_012228 [Vespula vulgaris]